MTEFNRNFIAALDRKTQKTPPIWIMRQAGRYLPEYRKVRSNFKNFLDMCKTPEICCELVLQPIERYDFDAAIIFSDILTIPDALGLGVSFVEGKGPVFSNPIKKPEDISKIDAIDEETANELINRSKETLIKEKEAVAQKLKELGVEEKLINLKGMTQGMLVILGQKNIKKLSDFADLSSDELIGGYDEIKGKKIRIDGYLEEFSLSRKEAYDLIMAAREIAYN